MAAERILPRLIEDGRAIELQLDGRPRRFHALWLRDNAQDAETRSPTNGQKLITLLDIPADTHIAATRWDGETLRLRFEPEGREIGFDPDWLLARAYDGHATRPLGWTSDGITRWAACQGDEMVVETYDAVVGDRHARRRWLAAVRRYGFARMTGAPTTPEVACDVAALFGYVRETNYGRTFDVRTETNANNLAYTNLGLQAHTDNPYREPVPGLQILACLRNTVDGGESVVVDGFKIAERLSWQNPAAFALLTRYPARFEYAGAQGVRLRAKSPLIEIGADGELTGVRFNNRSAAALVDIPYEDMTAYYAACRAMAELVEDPSLHIEFKLSPGELFMVDNRRVLHARRAFGGAGERWLVGCYADKDGLLSTLAALEEDEA